MKKITSILVLVLCTALASCTAPAPSVSEPSITPLTNVEETPTKELALPESVTDVPVTTTGPTETTPATVAATATQTLMKTTLPTATTEMAVTSIPESTQASSLTLPAISGTAPTASGALIIDHTAIEQFDSIPDVYIELASQTRILFRHSSVGKNIRDGLDCLMNVTRNQRRPNFCDRNIPPDQVVFDEKYDSSGWTFEFHSPPPSANPGWWNKVNFFIDRIDNLQPGEEFDYISFDFGYGDGQKGSDIDDKFFVPNPGDNLPGIEDLVALQERHPNMTIIWWTMNLARLSYADSQSFNQQLREFVRANNLILMDIADIESHDPNGAPCYDLETNTFEAICQDYTNETRAGHLNSLGIQRMAKAMWVLFARLAGWKG